MSSSDTSPTARALLALELVQGSPGITAGRLASGSESPSARPAATSRSCGRPASPGVERGRYGGYRVGRGLRLPPLMFRRAEALALVMAVLDGHHGAADPSDPGRQCAGQDRPVAPGTRGGARASGPPRSPAPGRDAARPDDPRPPPRSCRPARRTGAGAADLPARAGSAGPYVDPWAVVVRHGRWYLLCWSPRGDARRAYGSTGSRPSRTSPRPSRPPPDLDPVAELEAHMSAGWEYATDVLVDAPLETVNRILPAGSAGSRRLPRAAPGWWGARATPPGMPSSWPSCPTPFASSMVPSCALPRSRSPSGWQTPSARDAGGLRSPATPYSPHGSQRSGLSRGGRQAEHVGARPRRRRGRPTRAGPGRSAGSRNVRPTGDRAT